MANISQYLKQILSARYGRDVRQSIHDAIDAVNTSATDSAAEAEKAKDTALDIVSQMENVKLQAEATPELMGAVKYDDDTIKKNQNGQLYVNDTSLEQKYIKLADDVETLKTSKQNVATAITTSNISSQSVNYAASSGSATSATSATSAGKLTTSAGSSTQPVYFKDGVPTACTIPAELHRMFYRGKNLGTSFTATQQAHIKDGTFEDLWLGDYWVINGYKWIIADFDYWYNCGDTNFANHHLVIIPEAALYNAQMNSTNITTGGYVGSEMYTTNLANAKTIVNSAFGSAVLTHREYLVNAVSNGKPSGGAWYDSSVELPNECMMYGHPLFSPTSDGSTVPYLYTISKTQLALFMVFPSRIVIRGYTMWLRDVVSSAFFAVVSGYGCAAYDCASYSFGVRPVFPIG